MIVVRKLNLMALREINVGAKAFGSEKEKVMKLKEYEICLQSLDNNNSCSSFSKYLLTSRWSVY